jgi:hypothetical protein
LQRKVLTIEETNARGKIAKIRRIGNDPGYVEEWLPIPWLGRVRGDLSGAVDYERADREIVNRQGVLTIAERFWHGGAETPTIVELRGNPDGAIIANDELDGRHFEISATADLWRWVVRNGGGGGVDRLAVDFDTSDSRRQPFSILGDDGLRDECADPDQDSGKRCQPRAQHHDASRFGERSGEQAAPALQA